jgi:chromosome segregation ATPase
VVDLDQRLQRLEMEYTLRVMRVKDLISRFKQKQELVDILAHVHGIEQELHEVQDDLAHVHNIEQQFHLVQGDYELRTSSMQLEIDQCKGQMQTSSISRYSSGTIGGSSSAPRY